MKKYVDADALKAKAFNVTTINKREIRVIGFNDVDRAPAADVVEARYAEWRTEDGEKVYLDENSYTHGDAYCSGCGEHLDGSDEFAMPGRWCPKCGADMRGEKKSD